MAEKRELGLDIHQTRAITNREAKALDMARVLITVLERRQTDPEAWGTAVLMADRRVLAELARPHKGPHDVSPECWAMVEAHVRAAATERLKEAP